MWACGRVFNLPPIWPELENALMEVRQRAKQDNVMPAVRHEHGRQTLLPTLRIPPPKQTVSNIASASANTLSASANTLSASANTLSASANTLSGTNPCHVHASFHDVLFLLV
jgi:hypothetical protein